MDPSNVAGLAGQPHLPMSLFMSLLRTSQLWALAAHTLALPVRCGHTTADASTRVDAFACRHHPEGVGGDALAAGAAAARAGGPGPGALRARGMRGAVAAHRRAAAPRRQPPGGHAAARGPCAGC